MLLQEFLNQHEMIDLLDFEMPIYGEDRESEHGVPELAFKFKKLIKESDGIVISFAEHNGVYTAAFKNILDWISVVEKVVWCNKPMFLLATSNGARGAKTVLEIAHARISLENSNEIPTFLYLNTIRILIKLEELLIKSYWINLKILLIF